MNASIRGSAVLACMLALSAWHCGGDDGNDKDVGADPGADVAQDPGTPEDPGIPEDCCGADEAGPGEDPDTTEDTGPAEDPGPDAGSQAQRYAESDRLAGLVDPSLPAANTRCAVRLFQAIHGAEPAGANVFVSPLSVSTALAMVYQGATGDTRAAMAATLEYAGIEDAVLNPAWRDLIRSIEHVDDDVVLAIADAVWMDDAFAPAVKQAFLDAVVATFDSEVHTADFQAEGTLDAINGWVEDHTNGRIQDLIDQIPPSVVMYLINAIYFKADWLYPFDPDDTFATDFTRADGSKTTVDMMRFPKRVKSFAYTADDDWCVVRMPYGRDQVAFYGVIPWNDDDEKTIEDFIANMTAGQLEAFFAGVALSVVEGEGIRIWLPKFKIEYKKLLNDALVTLGMGPAFELGGFDGIAEGLGISRVIHQTFVEVDEKGTEAAAATAVEVFSGISPDFIGNKPFFFVIRDDRTGTILFMGKVADPKAG